MQSPQKTNKSGGNVTFCAHNNIARSFDGVSYSTNDSGVSADAAAAFGGDADCAGRGRSGRPQDGGPWAAASVGAGPALCCAARLPGRPIQGVLSTLSFLFSQLHVHRLESEL